ncbi:hypothetical protein PC110_g23736, partial [Phytophthora cactorum]
MEISRVEDSDHCKRLPLVLYDKPRRVHWDELVFCAVPEGVDLDGNFDCLELVKAIYGLKQASRVWNETFDEFVYFIGFQVSAFDLCLYIKVVDDHCVLVLIYVDDVLITGSSP